MTHITIPCETVQAAIDAMDKGYMGRNHAAYEAAITALRTALEAPEVTTTIDIHPDLADALAQQAAPAAQKVDDDLTIAYMAGYHKGKQAAPAAQKVEPYCWLYKDDMGECRIFFGTPPEYSLPLYRHPAPVAQQEKI